MFEPGYCGKSTLANQYIGPLSCRGLYQESCTASDCALFGLTSRQQQLIPWVRPSHLCTQTTTMCPYCERSRCGSTYCYARAQNRSAVHDRWGMPTNFSGFMSACLSRCPVAFSAEQGTRNYSTYPKSDAQQQQRSHLRALWGRLTAEVLVAYGGWNEMLWGEET